MFLGLPEYASNPPPRYRPAMNYGLMSVVTALGSYRSDPKVFSEVHRVFLSIRHHFVGKDTTPC